MVPSPGGMLSHYRLIEKIGEGGMGVVWSADDTVLGRQIAIKFLPDDFAQDAERLARFKQEARLLAALNHTNIAAIYGLEESEGARYLVLELVPGATLAERIEDGPLPIDEALNICRQIAEGLEAAHEKGIIHRDLKPGNVKVTPDGVVKVLDFGLAKSFGPESPASDLTRSPTITALGTVQGVILGTAAYMSPEQARGKAVDLRTDAWAFGCLLYELLTGRHAFQGETVSDTIAKILEREPDLDALPRATPARVRDLLRRCMTKDLKQRLQAIGEARIAIEEALASPQDSGAASARSDGADRWSRPRSVLAYVAVALIAGLLSGIGVSWLRRDRPAGGDDRSQGGSQHGRFSINLPAGQSLSSNSPVIALSPDGSRLAYVSNEGGTLRPYLRSIDSFEAIPIRGGEGGESPFFSPDGRQIGLFKDDKLQRIDLGGGPPVVLADAQWGHGAWGPDGTIVYTPSYATGLWRIAAAGGVPEELTTVDPSGGLLGHWWPDILPNGTAVLFTSFKTPAERSSLAVLSLANRETKILLEGGFFARYVPTGHILYTDGESLMAVPFDAERLEITGPAVPVVPDVAVNPSQGAAQFSISGEGTLVYVPASVMRVARELVWVDRDGQSSPVTGRRHPYADVKLSPDGKRIAVELPGDVWIHDIGRDTLERLTFEEGDQSNPLWTPDGRQIVFQSENPIFDLFWKRSDGSGRSDPLLINRNDKNPSSFSPDGTLLAYSQTTPDLLDDIMVLPLEGDREPLSFLRTRFSEGSPAFSPDGRFLAYQSDESGRVEVYVQSYPAGEGKWQISTDGGTAPLWARDGDELFYRNGRKIMAVDVRTEGGFSAGSRRLLFEGDYEHFERRTAYDISPDGQRFLMIRTPPESAPRQINVVLNWFEELKRLVPTGAH